MSDLRITKGNTFRTILEVKAYRYDNTEIKDFDLTDCIDMRIKCRIDGVIRDITQFRVIGPNQIEILWEKGKPGAYTIEMTGKYKQQNWRYYSKNPIFKIVDTTEDQNIPEDAILKNGTYYIQGSRIYLLATNPSEIKIDKITGHWMVGGEDTGFTARGEKGEKGDKGDPGEGVGDYTQLKNLPNLARVALTGDYSDLDNKPTIPTVPTRISQLINDAGFVTNSNIVKNYYNKTQVDEISNGILQNLAVVQIDDLDYLIECGLYRIDETTEQTYGSGQRFVRMTTTTPRLIAVVNQSTWRQNFTRNDVLQYDLQNRIFREAVLNPYSEGDIIGEDSWSDWMPMDDFAVKRLSEDNGDVIEDLVEPGVYRMDYTERAGQFNDKMSYFVIVDNSFDQDTRTTRQLRIDSEGIQLYERTDEVELDEDGEINVLEEGEWDGIELYQEVLVSGQNIKTINGQSILGSGNITVTAEAAYVQEQADWNQTDSTAVDYIKNKPVYLSNFINDLKSFKFGYSWDQIDTLTDAGVYIVNYNRYAEQAADAIENNKHFITVDNIRTTSVYDGQFVFTTRITQTDLTENTYRTKITIDDSGVTQEMRSEFNPQTNQEITYIKDYVTGEWMLYDQYQQQMANIQMWSDWKSKDVRANWNEVDENSYAFIENKPVLATVATTGLYNDLQGKPDIPNQVQQIINNSNFVTQSDLSGKVNASDLANVAFSGSYNDLTNTPEQVIVPTNVSAFTNDAGYITNAALNNYYTKVQIDAALAESGNFNPELYYTKTNIDNLLSSYSTIISTNSKLSGKVDVTTFNNFKGTLKNVATSGSYSDLTNTPTKLSDFDNDEGFLTEQKNSDWNAVNGVEEIKNKPDLSTYAQKTDLNDYVKWSQIPSGMDPYLVSIPNGNLLSAGWNMIGEVNQYIEIYEDWVSNLENYHVYKVIMEASQEYSIRYQLHYYWNIHGTVLVDGNGNLYGHGATVVMDGTEHSAGYSGTVWHCRDYELSFSSGSEEKYIFTIVTTPNGLVIIQDTPGLSPTITEDQYITYYVPNQ